MDQTESPTRVTFLWVAASGYMTACWRTLARNPEVTANVIALGSGGRDLTAYAPALVEGTDVRLLDERERGDVGLLASLIASSEPDAVVLSGWQHRPYLAALRRAAPRSARLVLGMDNPLRRDWRQRLAPLRIGGLLRRADAVWVPGERAWQLARYWKVPAGRIHRGLYGVDVENLEPLYSRRRGHAQGWPRRFLFAGRYHPRKGIDVLVEGYRRYRATQSEPWPLDVCGMGPLRSLFAGVEGIVDHGFVQPGEMDRLWERSGGFVLPSRYDAWPLALVEACAAGLPVLATEACGSSVELVRSEHNGWTAPAEDPEALAAGLRRFEAHRSRLADMGRRSQELASAYSTARWVERLLRIVRP